MLEVSTNLGYEPLPHQMDMRPIQLNAKQVRAIEWVTNRLTRLWGRSMDGSLSFALIHGGDGTFVLSATNVNSDEFRWYSTTQDWYGHIGVRGGVRKYAGNLSLLRASDKS
jgi:hypothetical protein